MGREIFMRAALEEARRGMTAGEGGPFGAVIIRDGEILARAHNTVLKDNDPTHHAEMAAISRACAKVGSYDLSGCEIYSTTEPCPMCFSAIHWARIDRLFFGTGISDVKALGFNELTLSVRKIKEIGRSPVIVEGGVLEDECVSLLEEWETLPIKKVY
ncbi:MAG: nucleoside deaminase [Candidatus Omnitrophica bacterium]|nr:nucleoside deaminase [Candidatus Omnitrophota bacterium]